MRRLLKHLAHAIAPSFMYRRQINRLTLQEPEITLLAAVTDDQRVSIDIGANKGLFVSSLLPLSKRVIAFEPLPEMADILRREFGDRIDLHSVALSDHEGVATIKMPAGNPSWATLAPTNALEKADPRHGFSELQVPLQRLDSYQISGVGFVKIDVEGHEEAVLRGSYLTIERERPVFLIEVEERHNAGSVSRVIQFFYALGYTGLFLLDGTLCPVSEFNIFTDQAPQNVGVTGKTGRYINNFFFIPSQRDDLISRISALASFSR